MRRAGSDGGDPASSDGSLYPPSTRSRWRRIKAKSTDATLITMVSALFVLYILLHEHIDRLIHACDGLLVILLHRFHDAVLHVLLQEELAGIIDLRTHCGELD